MAPRGESKDHGERTRRFELDSAAERATGWLRLAGAAVVALCAAWIAGTGPGTFGWVVVVVCVLISVGWFFAWRKGRARARTAGDWYLELGTRELLLAEGARRTQIPWAEVDRVDVDEDRLAVSVRRARDLPPMSIQMRYRGVSLHELGEEIRRAWMDARERGCG